MQLNGRRWRIKIGGDLISFILKIECIFGLPFSVAPFPLAYMCPWLVILPLWSAVCGWERTGRTGTCKPHDSMISFGGSWGYSGILIWLSLSEKFTLHHSSSLFLGQVISLAYWKSIMAGSILPVLVDFQCSTRLRNLILYDLIGVMQSITARSNSFLHQTNNNLYVIIAVEKATGPPVWGVHKITSKIYNCCFFIFNKILCFQYFLNFKYVLYIQYNNNSTFVH